jgi:hypothetical protein
MRWEYKSLLLKTTGFQGGIVDQEELDSQMNALGADDWELVAAFDTNQGYGATRHVVILFKRAMS